MRCRPCRIAKLDHGERCEVHDTRLVEHLPHRQFGGISETDDLILDGRAFVHRDKRRADGHHRLAGGRDRRLKLHVQAGRKRPDPTDTAPPGVVASSQARLRQQDHEDFSDLRHRHILAEAPMWAIAEHEIRRRWLPIGLEAAGRVDRARIS